MRFLAANLVCLTIYNRKGYKTLIWRIPYDIYGHKYSLILYSIYTGIGVGSGGHRQHANDWNATELCVWGLGEQALGNGILTLAFCP